MSDFMYIAGSVAFFAVALGYTWVCEKLHGRPS